MSSTDSLASNNSENVSTKLELFVNLSLTRSLESNWEAFFLILSAVKTQLVTCNATFVSYAKKKNSQC